MSTIEEKIKELKRIKKKNNPEISASIDEKIKHLKKKQVNK